MRDLLNRFENVAIWAMVIFAGFYVAFLVAYVSTSVFAILLGIAFILVRVCQRIHPYPLIGLAISFGLWLLIVLAKRLTRAPESERLSDSDTVADGSYGLYEKRHEGIVAKSKTEGSNDH